MAIWLAMFVDFEGHTTYTGNITVEDLGNGHAKGTVRDLSGPVPVEEIDLSGVVMNNNFVIGGSVKELGINLSLTFQPHVFAFAGSARIMVHDAGQVVNLFVLTQAVE